MLPLGLPGVSDGEFNELAGQIFKLLTIGNGLFETGGLFGADALTHVAAIAPDLMFVVRTHLVNGSTSGAVAILGLDAAFFHRVQSRHLFKDSSSLYEKISVHACNVSMR